MSSYAIMFKLDPMELLRMGIEKPLPEIEAYFKKHYQDKFEKYTDNVYISKEKYEINSITCFLAVQKLGRELTWFPKCVESLRLLHIEEDMSIKHEIFED